MVPRDRSGSVAPTTEECRLSYADRLENAVRSKGNPCLVGLDPHLHLMPAEFQAAHDPAAERSERASDVSDFLCQIIEVIADLAPAVKPQSAFFEELGSHGASAWEKVVRTARDANLIVIGDVKRGDIGSTAAAYARGLLGGARVPGTEELCDAITVNPYLGSDSIEPFLEVCRQRQAGIYVLVRTSNPGSSEFQTVGEPRMCDNVADAVVRWGAQMLGECGSSAVGAVVGATHPEELARMRARMPHTPFLLPGYGAQGAGAADVAAGFTSGVQGALVNSSRGILFPASAQQGLHWKDASRAALEHMISDIRAAINSPSGNSHLVK